MGQMTIDVDDSVHVDVGSSLVLLGAKNVHVAQRVGLAPDAPTLQLDVGGAMGEVAVR